MSAKNNRKAQRQAARRRNEQLRTYAIVGVLLVIAAVFAYQWIQRTNAPGALPLEISVEEAAAKRDAGALILDVREPEEWVDFHIPGATLIPLGQLAARVDELPGDQEIVVVCRSGNRSQSGRDILLDAGFTQVTSMAGGVLDWQASGFETVSGE